MKTAKKKKASEVKAANKAKRNESAGSATSASDASPRRGRGRPRKNSTARSPPRSPAPNIPLSPRLPIKHGSRGRPGKNSQIDIPEISAVAKTQSCIPRPSQCTELQRTTRRTENSATASLRAPSRIPRPAELQRVTRRTSSRLSQVQDTAE